MVITSATLDGEKFSAYFGDCPVLSVPGRVYEVQLVHSRDNHEGDVLGAAVDTCMQIHLHEPPGDILAFLTGQAEIDKVTPPPPFPGNYHGALVIAMTPTPVLREGTKRSKVCFPAMVLAPVVCPPKR